MYRLTNRLKGDLTLFYLIRDDGASGFYYADQDGTYLPFLTISLPALTWPILSPDSSVDIPPGFTETEMLVEGQWVKVWQRPEPEGRDAEYLVYLMGGDGGRRFYLYDRNNQLLIPYQENAPVPTEPTEPSATTPETDPVATTPTPTTPAETSEPGVLGAWQLMTFLFGIFCLILLGLIVWLLTRLRRLENLSKPSARTFEGWIDVPAHPDIRRLIKAVLPNRRVLVYMIVGGLTTLVNLVVMYLLNQVFGSQDWWFSTAPAILAAMIFAFL